MSSACVDFNLPGTGSICMKKKPLPKNPYKKKHHQVLLSYFQGMRTTIWIGASNKTCSWMLMVHLLSVTFLSPHAPRHCPAKRKRMELAGVCGKNSLGKARLRFEREWNTANKKTVHSTFDINIIIYLGCCPLPVTVTTRIITFLVGDPYKPSFATVTGRGDNPRYQYHYHVFIPFIHELSVPAFLYCTIFTYSHRREQTTKTDGESVATTYGTNLTPPPHTFWCRYPLVN